MQINYYNLLPMIKRMDWNLAKSHRRYSIAF